MTETVARAITLAIQFEYPFCEPLENGDVKCTVQTIEAIDAIASLATQAALKAIAKAGYLSPEQVKARDAAIERRALGRVANVVDQVLSKQDYTIPSNCICRNARDPQKRGEYCSERTRINCKGAARAAILALSPSPTNWQEVPDGSVVVPVELTWEMRAAAVNVTDPGIGEPPLYEKIYRAMIKAGEKP